MPSFLREYERMVGEENFRIGARFYCTWPQYPDHFHHLFPHFIRKVLICQDTKAVQTLCVIFLPHPDGILGGADCCLSMQSSWPTTQNHSCLATHIFSVTIYTSHENLTCGRSFLERLYVMVSFRLMHSCCTSIPNRASDSWTKTFFQSVLIVFQNLLGPICIAPFNHVKELRVHLYCVAISG